MPRLIKQAQRRRQFLFLELLQQAVKLFHGFLLHLLLHALALLVQLIQLAGHAHGLSRINTEKAANAGGHVFQSPRGVKPGANGESEVGSGNETIVPFTQT